MDEHPMLDLADSLYSAEGQVHLLLDTYITVINAASGNYKIVPITRMLRWFVEDSGVRKLLEGGTWALTIQKKIIEIRRRFGANLGVSKAVSDVQNVLDVVSFKERSLYVKG